jgi:hypothetical protein
MGIFGAPTGHLKTLTRIQWPMMPPFITVQSMYFASFGAENNPLDRAFGKLEGIGGGGDGGGGAPIPITLPRVLRFELFLIGILSS